MEINLNIKKSELNVCLEVKPLYYDGNEDLDVLS